MSPNDTERFHVLFVCLGNICRSPLAEGVFRELLRTEGLEDAYEVESAGTGAWHVGEAPDPRSTEVALRNGIRLEGRGRQVTDADFDRFDLLVAMDASNQEDLEALRDAAAGGGGGAEVRRLREFDPEHEGDLDVPDPYYGGPGGFDRVYTMVSRSCTGLLEELEARRR